MVNEDGKMVEAFDEAHFTARLVAKEKSWKGSLKDSGRQQNNPGKCC